MTFIPELITVNAELANENSFMALVDDYGHETPITESDIQHSLTKLASDETSSHPNQSLDSLMERVLAARAIA